jgi:hypothetical protein
MITKEGIMEITGISATPPHIANQNEVANQGVNNRPAEQAAQEEAPNNRVAEPSRVENNAQAGRYIDVLG